MLTHYATVLVFLALAVFNVAALLVVQWILAPRKFSAVKLTTYECGELPVGSARVQFNIRFYVIALVFVLFDAALVLLVPWAVAFRSIGAPALAHAGVGLLFLCSGLAYLWAAGDLDWVRTYRSPGAESEGPA